MTSRLLRDIKVSGERVTNSGDSAGPSWQRLAEAQARLARCPATLDHVLGTLAELTLELTGASSVAVVLDDGRVASSAQARLADGEPIDGDRGLEELAPLARDPDGDPTTWHLGSAVAVTVSAHGAGPAGSAGPAGPVGPAEPAGSAGPAEPDGAAEPARPGESPAGATPWGRWGVVLVVGSSLAPLDPDATDRCRALAAVADARLEAAWAIAAVGAQERDARSRLELAKHRRLLEEAQRLARVGSWEWTVSPANPGDIFAGGGVQTWSSMMYELLEVTPATTTPSVAAFRASIHADDQELPNAAVRRSLTEGVSQFEYRVPLADGSMRWLQGTAESVLGPDGSAMRVWGTALDITERRRAEGELRSAEQRFRLAMDYAPVGVALVGIDGYAIRSNRPLSALLGLGSDELVGAAVRSLVHPSDLDRAFSAALDLIAGGRASAECDLRLRRADGSYVWTTASASMLLDRDGAPQSVIVHVQDNTERRAQQEDLERQANTDPLTGLMNRRGWENALLSMLDSAISEDRPLAIGLLDLDHFKVYNDTFGHPAGDRLLADAARVWTARLTELSGGAGGGGTGGGGASAAGLGATLGRQPALARIGGEEFGVALPGCTADEARDVIAELCRLTPRGQSTSGGVTVWNHGEEMSDTLARADGALYSAKRKGRRRVIAVLPA